MSFEIRITQEAADDLRSIYKYIAEDLLAIQNAEGQLDRIEKGILSLTELPERFRAYEKEPWLGRGLRIMPIDNYLVFYKPDDDSKQVTIIRVLYGGMDIEKQLNLE